ncbi:hypothetical protein EV179_004932 [Coemansia sp. RSA 487]|nr:hypothetical protein LPJ74_001460 [Coemansia sp. RSA 1843]KAJ2212135.1 hypothetical protein EV179_004932 [Coemansia sp. RSA 487]
MVSISNILLTFTALLFTVHLVSGHDHDHDHGHGHGDSDSSIHVTQISPSSHSKPSPSSSSSECTDGDHKCTSTKFQVCIDSEWSETMAIVKNMTCTNGVFASTMREVNSTEVNLRKKCTNDQHYCEDTVFRVCVDSKWSREMVMGPGMSCNDGIFTSAASGAKWTYAPRGMAAVAGGLVLLLIHHLL